MTTADVKSAWKACTDESAGLHVNGGGTCAKSIDVLLSQKHQRSLASWLVCKLETDFLRAAKEILEKLDTSSPNTNRFEKCMSTIHETWRGSHERLQEAEVRLGVKTRSLRTQFSFRIITALQGIVPETFSERLYDVLVVRFRAFETGGAAMDSSERPISQDALCQELANLGFARAVQEAVTWIVFEKIDGILGAEDANSFDDHVLPKLVCQVEDAIIPWLCTVAISPSSADTHEIHVDKTHRRNRSSYLERWRMQLMFHLHEAVAQLRTRQILPIIRNYPSSTAAVEDLKKCLAATDFKPTFIASLRDQFVSNYLNAGTLTSEILLQYVNMIKALRILDTTGVILESVSQPIRSYLRLRPDTIRCIVNEMTVDGDLYGELKRLPSKRRKASPGHEDGLESDDQNIVDVDLISIDGDFDEHGCIDVEAYESWQPEPIDAPSKESGWKPGGDAIATLVTIYGTSDLLVSEYRTLLADRLIHNLDFSVEKEGKVLNLLIERFGADAIHECSIMLKDVKNSQQMLAEMSLSPKLKKDVKQFEATVISKEFWPKLPAEQKFSAPKEFSENVELFTEIYERAKDPRKLIWQSGLGLVSMNLTFDDGRTVELSVSPLQASILLLYDKKSKWVVSDLQKELNVSDKALMTKSLASLASKGVLRASNPAASEYETVEFASDADTRSQLEDDAHGAEPDAENEEADDAAQTKVFENVIEAMLKNFGPCALTKLHNTLKIFIKTPVYDRTETQLAALLARMVEEGKIEVQAGMFKSKPKVS